LKTIKHVITKETCAGYHEADSTCVLRAPGPKVPPENILWICKNMYD